MGCDIKIMSKGDLSLELEVSDNQIGICLSGEVERYDATIFFDMKSKEDREKIKYLIRQLEKKLKDTEWPPYATCPECSWLVRERGVEVCDKHKGLETK